MVTTDQQELIADDVVAAITGMSPRNVHRQARAGLMPRGVKIGALRRWSRAELLDWIRGGCRPVGGPPAGGKPAANTGGN